MMRRRLAGYSLAVAACIGMMTLTACGYALVGRGSNLPPEVKRIYLQPFGNATARFLVDQILTQAVADELVTRQRFVLASSAASADAVMEGRVATFDVRPVTFDDERRATEYEITITASVILRQISPETILWQNDRYQFRDSYQLEASDLGFQDRETPAIEATAKKFAETMLTDLFEGF